LEAKIGERESKRKGAEGYILLREREDEHKGEVYTTYHNNKLDYPGRRVVLEKRCRRCKKIWENKYNRGCARYRL